MESVIGSMRETLEICERAQRSAQTALRHDTFPFSLTSASGLRLSQLSTPPQIQSGRRPSGDLRPAPRARRDSLDVPCTYHKGAKHTLRGCRLRKKIDQELPRRAKRPTQSPDCGEFQKVRVRISPNDSDIVFRQVLVISENEPPRAGATNSEEAARIQANARRAQRCAEEQQRAVLPCARDLCLEFEEAGIPTFNSPQANLGAAVTRLQQAR